MPLPVIQHAGISFSGYFPYDLSTVNKKSFESLYKFSDFFDKNREYLSQKYYSNWLRTLYPDSHSLQHFGLRDFRSNHLVYQGGDRDQLTLATAKGELPFGIERIDIFLFPHGLAMFSISVSLDPKMQNFDDISMLTSGLRNTTANSPLSADNPLIGVIETKITPFFTQDITSWKQHNPHLKLFVNIDVRESFSSEREWNELLMELAMNIPLGTVSGRGLYAPSAKYAEQLFQNNIIEVFNNWKAICLFDSLVRVSINLKEADAHNLWETDYYYIYVFTSFIRFYLYQTNARLSLLSRDINASAKLRSDYLRFINDFDLTQISYKFLPNVIYKHLLSSMEIKDELQRIEQKLGQIDTMVREHQEHKRETFIKLVIFFTIFSILFDSINLVRMQIGEGEDAKTVTTNRIIFAVVLLIVVAIASFVYVRQRRKER